MSTRIYRLTALAMALLLVVVACISGVRPAVGRNGPAGDPRPNIVVLMVDDIAQMDDRVWEHLPMISGMFLNQGVRFTDYQGQDPLCCPGRANFLSGQTADHHGVVVNQARLFDPRETIATELQGVGYYTAIVGKYFNGTHKLTNFTPPGWDHLMIMDGGYTDIVGYLDGAPTLFPYTTDSIKQNALTFLREAPAAKPVFMLVTPFAPHSDHANDTPTFSAHMPTPAERHVGDPRCAGIPNWKPPSYMEANVSDKPAYVRAMSTSTYPSGWPLRTICESLLSVDETLRAIRDEMLAEGRKTLYVLTDDNGMTFGEHRVVNKSVPYATPLPLFFRGANGYSIGPVPRTETATVENIDFASTLCAIAGCTMGPYPNGYAVDGQSFLPVLLNQATTTNTARPWIYVQGQKDITESPGDEFSWRGVRSTDAYPLGRWEYTEYSTGECELYDLTADPWELVNRCNDPAYAVSQAVAEGALAAF